MANISEETKTKVAISKTNIAWPHQLNTKYKRRNRRTTTKTDLDDETIILENATTTAATTMFAITFQEKT